MANSSPSGRPAGTMAQAIPLRRRAIPATQSGARQNLIHGTVRLTSALGHKQTLGHVRRHVRFTPESGHTLGIPQCPLSAEPVISHG
jgi:hypothetical protein